MTLKFENWCVLLLPLVAQVVAVEHKYQSYQRSITCTTNYLPCYPRSIPEIQNVIRYAISRNVNVKAVGSKHSISDSICTNGVPIYMIHINHFSYNPQTQTATVGAGMRISDFLENLHNLGRTVSGVPEYGGVTIGGVIATGSHGTGLKYPSTLSEQLVSVTLVDGRGNVRKITRDHEHFKALRVNLGLLGIIYEVEISTEPQYKLHIRHYPISESVLRNGSDIGRIARLHDYFQFWWFPTNMQIVLAVGTRVPISTGGNCSSRMIKEVDTFTKNAFSTSLEMFQSNRDDFSMFHLQTLSKLGLYRDILVTEPAFMEDDGLTPCIKHSVGFSHRMVTSQCESCLWDEDDFGGSLSLDTSAIAVPAPKLMPALRTLWEMFEKRLTQFPNGGIQVRFLTAADGYMALNEGEKEWAVIEWTTTQRWDKSQPKMGISTYQAMSQVLVKQYGGRPHWAKNGLYYSSAKIIREAHPNLHLFIDAMNAFDPQEIFLNSFGERLKHNHDYFTVTSEFSDHCALSELCICKRNSDCGMEGFLDHYCGLFPGFPKYPVCLPGLLEIMKETYTRTVIGGMASMVHNEYSIFSYLQQYSAFSNLLPTLAQLHG